MLSEMKMPRKLFLTGTPIQNNLSELWSLLHFLNPEIFTDLEKFKGWFAKVDISSINNKMGDQSPDAKKKATEVVELHLILKPFLLRRLKSDVLIDLPPKLEFILYTGMSKMQKEVFI